MCFSGVVLSLMESLKATEIVNSLRSPSLFPLMKEARQERARSVIANERGFAEQEPWAALLGQRSCRSVLHTAASLQPRLYGNPTCNVMP